ncbi:type II secretion system protein [Massilia sp. DD77]|uniref:type II secretion system protein n=1 Tax=Massilia sp. DD77 TaxID=3109349 RepID=UPI003000BA24
MSSKMGRQRGLTLIEMILFIVIVGIALAAVVGVLNYTTRNSAEPLRRKQALMIAEGLLEEVRLARFTWCDPSSDDPNPETVTSSANCLVPENWGSESGTRPFDNVNDYVPAANQATAAFNVNGVLSDANGAPLGVQGYAATVTITPQAMNGVGAPGAAADTDLLRIRVEVAYDGQRLVLDGYRARYAPLVQ